MRAAGVRGLLIHCSEYHRSHSIAITGDQWPDQVSLSDLEPRFIRLARGIRDADLKPDFPGWTWDRETPFLIARPVGEFAINLPHLPFKSTPALDWEVSGPKKALRSPS
jgi:hypothetical protein